MAGKKGSQGTIGLIAKTATVNAICDENATHLPTIRATLGPLECGPQKTNAIQNVHFFTFMPIVKMELNTHLHTIQHTHC